MKGAEATERETIDKKLLLLIPIGTTNSRSHKTPNKCLQAKVASLSAIKPAVSFLIYSDIAIKIVPEMVPLSSRKTGIRENTASTGFITSRINNIRRLRREGFIAVCTGVS